MLRTTSGSSKPEIERAITDLLRENSNFDRNENRSAIREHLVRPVEIDLRESEETLVAFSRNISAMGIGIITDQPIVDRAIAVLKITRITGEAVSILAECRWCRSYGENWHLSGWQFINLKR